MRNDGVAPCLRGGALRRGRLEIAGCVHWKYYSDAHSQGRSVLHLSCQLRRIEPMLGACSSMRIYIAFSKCRHTGLNRLYINQTRNSGGVRDATPVCTERIRTPRTEMTSRAGIRGLKHRTMDMVLISSVARMFQRLRTLVIDNDPGISSGGYNQMETITKASECVTRGH